MCGCQAWVTLWVCCSLAVRGVLLTSLGFCPPVCKVRISCVTLPHREGFAHHECLVGKCVHCGDQAVAVAAG